MIERLVDELDQLVDELEKVSAPLDSEALARLADHIAKAFAVQPDEVAILTVVQRGRVLKFLLPEKLQTVGTIPLNSTSALAARTARERRPDLMNNFSSSRHASVFEGVPLGQREGELIHKIMSAPIIVSGKLLGVVQISRKGRSPADAGPDFTPKDLRELSGITSVLGRFLQLSQGS